MAEVYPTIVFPAFIEILLKSSSRIDDDSQQLFFKQLELNSKSILGDLTVSQGYLDRGISEPFFCKFLNLHFNGRVLVNKQLIRDRPDMLLLADKQIIIDLEIDEPYNGRGKPIHCGRSDNERNLRFANAGIIVIRLCEDQILFYPDYCLDVINATVGLVSSLGKSREEFEKTVNQNVVDGWSSEKALSMFTEGARRDLSFYASALLSKL